MSRVRLLIGDREFIGWTSLSVKRSIEDCASSFSAQIALGVDSPGVFPISPGDAVQIKHGEDLILTGYLDALQDSVSGSDRFFSITGRSKTADLVDCSPTNAQQEHNERRFFTFVDILAKQYGLEVVFDDGVQNPFVQKFMVDLGATCFEAIDRFAKMAQALVTDTPEGHLWITKAGTRLVSGALVRGENILSGTVIRDLSQCYTDYIVYGQTGIGAQKWKELQDLAANLTLPADTKEKMEKATRPTQGVARETDDLATRSRYLRIKADSTADAAECRRRALWERRTRHARALEATYTIEGWRDGDDKLFGPNTLVEIHDPFFFGPLRVKLLIAEIEYNFTEQEGETCTMKTAYPAAYEVQYQKDKKDDDLQNLWIELEKLAAAKKLEDAKNASIIGKLL